MARPSLRSTGPARPPLRRRLLRLYAALHRRFGPQPWPPVRSAPDSVVSAILTQSLARVNVERAAGRRAARARRLAALIRRHGGSLRRFLRQPAAALRARLLAAPGIGPAAADRVLLYAAGRPVFVADGSVRRVLVRHRLVPPDTDDAGLRAVFMDNLPRDPALFQEYHALLVRAGKEYCRAYPRCAACPLRFDLRGRAPRKIAGSRQPRAISARSRGGSANIAR